MSELNLTSEQIEEILTPQRVRQQAQAILELTRSGLGQFELNEELMNAAAEKVVEVTRQRFPDLDIPYHSRWGHFRVGGVNRLNQLKEKLQAEDSVELARTMYDLVITSVLLDAGAGDQWQYSEPGTGYYRRSEGLAVASFQSFLSGAFSSDPEHALQANAQGLSRFTEDSLKKHFQVSVGNALEGTRGRAHLIQALGKAVGSQPEYFGDSNPRPGGLVDYFLAQAPDKKISAPFMLKTILKSLGSIWPGRLASGGINLGDVWWHEGLGQKTDYDALVPFHKLSQWLTYSLIEPLEELGFEVSGLDDMTALAEYRNGGFLVDCGLITPRDKGVFEERLRPDSVVIIEWRALTVSLIDELAVGIRNMLQLKPDNFPLVKVLEGGTWWAGRYLAKEKRPAGGPPLSIMSDGTVF